MKKVVIETGTLRVDIKIVNKSYYKMKKFKLKRIHHAFQEYIDFLENEALHNGDLNQQFLIRQEINKLKKEQEKYYVPKIMKKQKRKNKNYVNFKF